MQSNVTIVDYGIGNLLSVTRAFEYCGAKVEIASSTSQIENAKRLVLPGVGAFADGMQELSKQNFITPIKNYINKQKPFLGICLGMQMMLGISEEFGNHEGLNLIPGKVVAIPNTTHDGRAHKIPHIGWNNLLPAHQNNLWDNTILHGVNISEAVYFVHSYMSVPNDPTVRLADCDYNGRKISAVIQSKNVIGCQFHPEKSGEVGLKIIKNFISMMA